MADDNFELGDIHENGDEATTPKVVFNEDQLAAIQAMLDQVRKNGDSRRPDAISMYNLRDPKKIESVMVKRIDGKFVMGWKNLQKDSMKKKAKWLDYKKDESRGLLREPFVTLLLQEDEKSPVEEKEMLLLDYVTDGKRDQFKAKVVRIDEKDIIEDHGILGSKGEYAGEIDDKGMPVQRTTVLAQTKRTERVFYVELPGFSKPQMFISDWLA